MVTISSSTNSTFHELRTFNSESKTHLSDAIFSLYLNDKEGTEPSQKLGRFNSNKKSPLNHPEKKEENGEIGVFGAEKYFNGGEVNTPRAANIVATRYLHQRDENMVVATRKHTIQYGTPSILSESTTCNSQSVLLHGGMRNSLKSRKEKGQAKSVLAGLGFKCSCSDKDSVDAGEISFNKTASYGAVHGKTTPRKLIDIAALDASHSIKVSKPNAELLKISRDVYFQKQENTEKNSIAFSTMSPGLGNQNHVKMQQLTPEEEEQPRKSLEVFGSPILRNKRNSLSFDKRLIMPVRDAAPKVEEIEACYNDAASDASSDLFEIESIKGKTNPFLARQASDVASSCVSPTNYAPSEASIEWSVATASAAVMSDCEDQMSEETIRSPIKTSFTPSNVKAKANKEVQRRRPSVLLGCKSHKAVRVAGDAFITYEKTSSTPQFRNKTNSSQLARFPSETKLGNFGARHGQHHAYATPTLQHSHSPHASKLLYI
ncbi:protein PHYTOCHROME KINASE SUBSTRATE 1-like [Abrus precatorius]|uniref:Protein PHYTOCHROME KINASE SUBSTRATE 1-like n=1 Tax=Abrus precatorius TaxID=3816 RepID=A0A8B8KSD3_ABRPR|nr:protein PHYTOCHROME KINASE SUBSTRATE 1-like [Abrus precatorius]